MAAEKATPKFLEKLTPPSLKRMQLAKTNTDQAL